jgi:hypothetical protein
MAKIIPAISVILLMFITNKAFSQWEEGRINVIFSVPEIALIDIESHSSGHIHFTVTSTGVSGETPRIEESSGEQLWINYSSALSQPNRSRTIIAEMLQTLPDGLSMFLEASAYRGTGKGRQGTTSGKINLSRQPQPIISGMGNCYTGDGVNNGHSLAFSIEITDYEKIKAMNESEFTVVYTITDN